MRELSPIKRVAIIIAALNPDERLIGLVHQLCDMGFERSIIVNDGSKASADWVFNAFAGDPRITILKHAANCGKGRALKTAFNYFLTSCHDYDGVVTVDADGQHAPEDVREVAETTARLKDTLVLGTRSFTREVPLKSRIGNLVTRYVFRFLLGRTVSDTQTGLRGIPTSFLAGFFKLPGERYEYEASMLIYMCRNSGKIVEKPIKTIYAEGNKSSHFNAFTDSLRIYFVLIRFGISAAFLLLYDRFRRFYGLFCSLG